MKIENISRKVQQLHKKYGPQNLHELCRALKISLLAAPMGECRASCKGFYLKQSRKQAIVINSDLTEELQRIILAHEIGHATLHRSVPNRKAFHDFTLFDETTLYEYEANIFAAEYLITDDAVLALVDADDNISIFTAASQLHVPCELLDFKLRVLKKKGHPVIEPPLHANADFLKHVKLSGKTYE